MAGDWIKMRVALAEDPAVIGIAARVGIDEFAVVGRLHALWSWADSQSRDGHASGVTASWINRKLQCDKFAEAMAAVKWLIITDTGITFPNFENHNGDTAKSRALGKNRQQKHRSSQNNDDVVTEPSRNKRDKNVTREEKRRDKKTTFSSEDMRLAEFIQEGVLQVSPDFKKPKTLDKWANTVRLMREQDSLEHRHIAEVFKFANLDSFWKTNILSPEKLREKFAQLSAKKLEAANGQRNQHSRPSKSQSDEQALRDYHAELAAQEAALLGVAGVIEPPLGVSPGRQH